MAATLRHRETCPRMPFAARRPTGWTEALDRRLLNAMRSGRVTPGVLRDFAADGWASEMVLNRCQALLAGADVDPVSRALVLLGPRVRPIICPKTFPFELDGRGADAAALIREANKGLANLNLAPIAWPGVAA